MFPQQFPLNSVLSLSVSPINEIGTRSLALLYGAGAVSCWYAPAFVQHLSPSWAIVVAFVTQAVYVSTFFYPKSFTLFPSALLAGSTLGPLFSAQTSFLMHLVSR